MSHKRNEALRHVQHSMHHVIAAGEGSDRAPDSCKLCPYYRPDFKFRTCLYSYRKIDRGGETVRRHVLCQSPRCHQTSGRLP